jgi:hypothetical protein
MKYIRSTRGDEETHDLASDPEETQNIVEDPRSDAIRRRAKEIISKRDQELVRPDRTGDTSPEMLERLKSLGYIH